MTNPADCPWRCHALQSSTMGQPSDLTHACVPRCGTTASWSPLHAVDDTNRKHRQKFRGVQVPVATTNRQPRNDSHGPVHQRTVAVGGNIPMVLDAALDISVVRDVAGAAPHPLVHGPLLDPQGSSGELVVRPEIRQVSSVALQQPTIAYVGLVQPKEWKHILPRSIHDLQYNQVAHEVVDFLVVSLLLRFQFPRLGSFEQNQLNCLSQYLVFQMHKCICPTKFGRPLLRRGAAIGFVCRT